MSKEGEKVGRREFTNESGCPEGEQKAECQSGYGIFDASRDWTAQEFSYVRLNY